jgi:hypothetical protein
MLGSQAADQAWPAAARTCDVQNPLTFGPEFPLQKGMLPWLHLPGLPTFRHVSGISKRQLSALSSGHG